MATKSVFGRGSEEDRQLRKKCHRVWLTEGAKGIALFSSAAWIISTGLNYIWKPWKNLNWRPKIFLISGIGVAGFWIQGEKALVECQHSRDAQRFAEIDSWKKDI